MMDIFSRYLKEANGNKVVAATNLSVGLMRGDRATVKAGYTLANALLAVTEAYNLTRTEVALTAEKIVNARKPFILTQVEGGIADSDVYRGEADLRKIDWDNIDEGGELDSNLDSLEEAESLIEELGGLTADTLDQRDIERTIERLKRRTIPARQHWNEGAD